MRPATARLAAGRIAGVRIAAVRRAVRRAIRSAIHKRLEQITFEDFDLLLHIGQRAAAILHQLRTTLVGGQRLLKTEFAAFHLRHQGVKFTDGGLKRFGRI